MIYSAKAIFLGGPRPKLGPTPLLIRLSGEIVLREGKGHRQLVVDSVVDKSRTYFHCSPVNCRSWIWLEKPLSDYPFVDKKGFQVEVDGSFILSIRIADPSAKILDNIRLVIGELRCTEPEEENDFTVWAEIQEVVKMVNRPGTKFGQEVTIFGNEDLFITEDVDEMIVRFKVLSRTAFDIGASYVPYYLRVKE